MVNSDFVNTIEKLLDLKWCIPALISHWQAVRACTTMFFLNISLHGTKRTSFTVHTKILFGQCRSVTEENVPLVRRE
jgi:hypothetical protein